MLSTKQTNELTNLDIIVQSGINPLGQLKNQASHILLPKNKKKKTNSPEINRGVNLSPTQAGSGMSLNNSSAKKRKSHFIANSIEQWPLKSTTTR